MSQSSIHRRRAVATTSWLALGLSLSWGAVQAQTTDTTSGSPTAPAAQVADVVVVGARASQQSALQRKKRAITPTDSIVADDVGSFPDRNVNEAISRIAGVALDRNDFGEGQSVSIRGNGPEFTRVELDGIGVQSTAGSLAGNEDGSGRGADMRELPADLIKSVDIIKGSTADMTEGSLGGSIRITTRSGLDFKKPYFTLRLGAQRNDQDEKTTYDHNFVAARQFLDGRLGVIFSASGSNTQKTASKNEVVTSNNSGYARIADFDNSPEKTFKFNADILRGDTADTIFPNSAYTPRQLLARAASAETKAQCETLFPIIDSPFGSSLTANQSNALRDQKRQRIDEQITCLNQWNDHTPSNLRNFINSEGDKKLAVDLRLDFRVTDNLKVYAKYAIADRDVDQQTRNQSFGNIASNGSTQSYINSNPATCATAFNALAGQFAPGNPFYLAPLANPNRCAQPGIAAGTGAGQPASPRDRNFRRGIVANGYYTFNPNDVTGRGEIDIAPGTATANFTFPIYGTAINVDPSTVEVDANHHVTAFDLTNGTYNIDQISNYRATKSSYMQVGGEYDDGPLRIEFVANRSQSDFSKQDFRTSRAYDYGAALGANGRTRVSINDVGVWEFELPAGFDPNAIENYTQVGARLPATAPGTPSFNDPNAATRPTFAADRRTLVSRMFTQQYSPGIEEGEETAVKFDLTYDLREKSEFFRRFKSGVSYRNAHKDAWRGGFRTVTPARGTYGQAGYVAPVIVPSNQIRAGFRACEAAGPASQGFEQCNYGFVTTDNISGTTTNPPYNVYSRSGITTVTPAELTRLLTENLEPPVAGYFVGYPGAPAAGGFEGINVNGLFSQTGIAPYLGFDCMKVCTGSDGKPYEQPRDTSDETVIASYAMLDFGHELLLGMELEGNVGIRRVQQTTEGQGAFTYQSILRRPTATDPNATVTYSRTQQFAIDHTSIDFLPTYNLSLWVVPDKVVLRGYTGKTVSRPPIGRLIPRGTCTYDERLLGLEEEDGSEDEGLADLSCSTQGNPDLKPYTAYDYDLSVEWYPNRDTMFSVAWHKLDVKIGGPITITQNNFRLFEGTDAVDPETGAPLADLEFSVPTYTNGPGFERTGVEFTAKTAFTFLPGLLRHTGADFNYSELKASGNDGYRDPLTGAALSPPGQSDYFANLSLWYDDGRTQARVAYQARGQSLSGISGLTNNNVNSPPVGNLGENLRQPYLIGEPYFREETAYIDAKITYKLNRNVEVYLEGRNLTREANVTVGSPDRAFENGTNLWQLAYGGRRFMTGVVFRFGS